MSDPMVAFGQQSALMLGQGADELVYIIAVLIFVAIGWIAERFKAKMEGAEQERRRQASKPPPAKPRPPIARADDTDRGPGRARPAVPPSLDRPRRAAPSRPAPPARPAPTATPRTVDERRAVIRGEPTRPTRPSRPPQRQEIPRPTPDRRPAPARPKPTPPPKPAAQPSAAQAPQTWSRLAKFGEQIRAEAEAKQLDQIQPAEALEAAVVRGRVGAESFRRLTRADLQRAFVLKEILEPPLALRDVL